MTALSKSQQAKLAAELVDKGPAPEWDTIPEIKKWKEKIITPKDKNGKVMTFYDMVIRERELAAEIEFRKNQLDPIKQSLLAAMLVADTDKVGCEGYNVCKVSKSGSKKVSVEKLMRAGVDADTIAACTEQGAGNEYVQVKVAKDK